MQWRGTLLAVKQNFSWEEALRRDVLFNIMTVVVGNALYLLLCFFKTKFVCAALAVLVLCHRPDWTYTQRSLCLCILSP